VNWHAPDTADITVATLQTVPRSAHHFGIAEIDHESRIVGFEESPDTANPSAHHSTPPNQRLHGDLYFKTRSSSTNCAADAPTILRHDFAKTYWPKCLARRRVVAWDFHDMNRKASLYWRDVGYARCLLRSQYGSGSVSPESISTIRSGLSHASLPGAPAKFVFAAEGQRMASRSIPSFPPAASSRAAASIAAFFRLRPRDSYCEVDESILLPRVDRRPLQAASAAPSSAPMSCCPRTAASVSIRMKTVRSAAWSRLRVLP